MTKRGKDRATIWEVADELAMQQTRERIAEFFSISAEELNKCTWRIY